MVRHGVSLNQDKDQKRTCRWIVGRSGCKQTHDGDALIALDARYWHWEAQISLHRKNEL